MRRIGVDKQFCHKTQIAADFAHLAKRVNTIDIVNERDVLNFCQKEVANNLEVTAKCWPQEHSIRLWEW